MTYRDALKIIKEECETAEKLHKDGVPQFFTSVAPRLKAHFPGLTITKSDYYSSNRVFWKCARVEQANEGKHLLARYTYSARQSHTEDKIHVAIGRVGNESLFEIHLGEGFADNG